MIYPIANLYFSSFAFNGFGAPAFPKKNGKYDWHTVGFNTANGVKAMSFLQNLVKQNVVPKDADYGPMDTNFTAGKVGFAINGPWTFPTWSKALGSNLGVANIPKLPNGKPSKPYVGIRGWEVNAFSQNKADAWSLAKFLSLHGQAIMSTNEGRLPVLKKAPGVTLSPLQKAAVKQYKVGVPMPNIAEFGAVWDPMGAALTNVVQGKATPKVALVAASNQIKAKISDMHQ
jgi:arabinogalactan oligomer/maltooligosaccharide transport system substrate-binding protein